MPLDLVAIAYGGLAALAFSTRKHALDEPWCARSWRVRWRRAAILLLVLVWTRASTRYGFAMGTVAMLGITSVMGVLLVLALSKGSRAALTLGAACIAAGIAFSIAPIS
ncbi:DUF3325 family protein [Sphingomonas sp. 22176]|uniref:DUF3325 family protein n=1 Tax=Sphingomonas sp. 22176 TaxID=3453884 RepID=UPI003F87E238